MPIPEDPADAARRRIEEGIARREARDAARARTAQAAAGPPSTSSARAAQAAAGPPSTARARAAQAAANNNMPTVRRETLPAIQGGGSYGGGGGGSRAVAPSDAGRPPAPSAGGAGNAVVSDRRIPLNFGSAASTAADAGKRVLARGLGAAGMVVDPNSAGRGSSLTSNAEGAAAVQRQSAEREARLTMSDPNYAETADAAAATLRAHTQARQTTRPTTRMSPREMSPDELHNIYSLTNDPESSIAEMRGPHGQAARNIIARRTELAREAELEGMKRGGPVKKMAKGGAVKSSASGRSDGCAVKGKTKGRMV